MRFLDVAPQTIAGQPINIAARIRIAAAVLQRRAIRTGRNPFFGINAVARPALGQFLLAQRGRNVRFWQQRIIRAGIAITLTWTPGANSERSPLSR